MWIGRFKFDRREFAGSLGDLGTLVPLSVAMLAITGISSTATLLMIGLFYLASGLYFRLPLPVQPLKVVAAIAIAFPEKITLSLLAAAGIEFSLILLVLTWSGLLDRIGALFSRPVVRGIQLGLGLILMGKGMDLVLQPGFFLGSTQALLWQPFGISVPLNLVLGGGAFVVTLVLLRSTRLPAALVLVTGGILLGIFCGALTKIPLELGPQPLALVWPQAHDWTTAFFLLVLPQIPLTLGNAVYGTVDACHNYFRDDPSRKRVTNKGVATSMGIANLAAGVLGAMLMCHGAGGLAAHYRFGARTGGSNLMIGAVFVCLALLFGRIGLHLLTAIPGSILGILLIFAGIELASLILDVGDKTDLFVTLLIAGVALTTTHMGLAFVIGIFVLWIIRYRSIEF